MRAPKPHSILFVDDDEDDAFLFESALKEVDRSIKYVYYQDSEKALRDLKSFTLNPDYIFLDLNMPKINGIEVLKELMKIKRFWNIPIAVLSTTKNPDHIASVKALGAKFIHKPNSIPALVQEIKNALIGAEAHTG